MDDVNQIKKENKKMIETIKKINNKLEKLRNKNKTQTTSNTKMQGQLKKYQDKDNN